MIQLSSGRLLMPSRICHSNNQHPGLEYERVSSYGILEGAAVAGKRTLSLSGGRYRRGELFGRRGTDVAAVPGAVDGLVRRGGHSQRARRNHGGG